MALFLVTGAAGFIGSHLVDGLLAAGHSVRGLDDFSSGLIENLDPRCQVLRADVADPIAVHRAMQGVDGCFHLAAIASVARTNEDWLGTHRTNQTGTITVLDAARRCGGVPVVYASSAAVYGDVVGAAAHEAMLPRPRTAYGADKLGSELHAAAAWHVHQVPSFGLRFFNVYGPRQNPCSPYTGVISIFAQQMATGSPVTVHGDGRQIRDFVHVSDVVAHLTAAMRHLQAARDASVVNVCTGRPVSVLDVIRILGEIHGRTPRIVHGPERAGDIRQSVGDPSAARNMLGVQYTVTLEDGLSTLTRLASAAA
ncbi:NAD-dependent epimerase/dehydratase family protein [Limobrevibacterium gyesilva]|uniref:NAD-dependent epimerase/dehydratase family protein n=1 Tax=Limobrevibacterium gyesilva TaxID=2991712 RepID=A0AA41YXR9_9PROT|nr:NAD-dependent epimerase/dehydratase family protein [Limobrevibacterium gyesilva]